MRRLSVTLFALLAFSAMAERTVHAQITLVPGLQSLVSQQPKFIAAADFNKDGVQDAVVTNTSSAKVTILFGGPRLCADGITTCSNDNDCTPGTRCGNSSGGFSALVDASVGRVLRGITAGDLNQDGNPDIAVVDVLQNRAFVIYGNGDGTLQRPASFKVGLRPVDVAIGNFDKQNGNDLVIADSGSNKATVLLNLGGTRGFTPLGDIDLGKTPKRIIATDLNGDGLDDIVAVNTGSRAADDVTVLLNTGVGSFQFPVNFVVGAGAADVKVADVNNDGVPDLLVLNSAVTSVANQFTASVLINQTTIVDGQPTGTGFFNSLTPVQLRCPSSLNGIPIRCTPNFLAAADYNGDGNVDFVVSFFTAPTIGTAQTPGLVDAFAGRGDGTFDFATQVGVALNPQGVVAGDFTGDGIPDVAVAETGNRTVRIIRSLLPEPGPPGGPCNVPSQCETHFCVDHTCCVSNECPSGEFCDVPGSLGMCAPPAPNGTPCDPNGDETQCASGNCVQGFCCASPVCPAGLFCNTGICGPPAPNGTLCDPLGDPAQCDSGNCVNGVCCASASCPSGESCNVPDHLGECAPSAPNGTPCTDPAQCTSGNCVDGACCDSAACSSGHFCNTGTCELPSANGTHCTLGPQCDSGNCIDGICCASAVCPSGQFCNIPGSLGTCSAPGGIGIPCTTPAQCSSGNCVDGFCCSSPACDSGQFCNTGDCGPPAGNGAPCNNGEQCDSGNCVDHVCCASASCPTNEACNVPPSLGECTAKNPQGVPCTDPAQCQSGFCTDGVCCNFSSCPAGQVCGPPNGSCIFRPTATKTPSRSATPTPTGTPLPTGRACTIDTQCVSTHCTDGVCCDVQFCPAGMACNVSGREGQCVVKPTATPTVPLPLGLPCGSNTQCLSGHCTDGACCAFATCPAGQSCAVNGSAGQCVAPPPTMTPTPAPNGVTCSTNSNCTSTHCTDGVCCPTDNCGTGQACNVAGHVGQCAAVPTPTRTPIPTPTSGILGDPCDPGNPTACASGFCVDGICCDMDSCFDGQRCDISGFEGSCMDQLDVDQPCDKGTDCLSGLLCLFDPSLGYSVCSPQPSPTPTLFPLSTPVPTLAPEVHLSRSGGCSIGGGGDGAGLWIVAALPLFAWLGRRLVGVRVRAGRRLQRR